MGLWSNEDNKLFASVGGTQIQTGPENLPAWNFGWFPIDPLVDARIRLSAEPLFAWEGSALKGDGAGKTVLLYEAARKVLGRDLDSGPQLIGDCVGWGFAGAVDLLACVEVLAGQPEAFRWPLRTSTEAVYALSRVEYGDAGRWDGSSSVWAAEAVRLGGTLSREEVARFDGNRGEYSGNRARDWGRSGLPDELEGIAAQHKVARTALVQSYSEARDAIANGYPIAVGSDVGFVTKRDVDGFCKRYGRWSHCMKFVAAKDDDRPGLLCMNSWGNESPTGPTGKYAIPKGSFWVEAEVVDRMLEQRGAFALAGFAGYRPRAAEIAKFLLTSPT